MKRRTFITSVSAAAVAAAAPAEVFAAPIPRAVLPAFGHDRANNPIEYVVTEISAPSVAQITVEGYTLTSGSLSTTVTEVTELPKDGSSVTLSTPMRVVRVFASAPAGETTKITGDIYFGHAGRP